MGARINYVFNDGEGTGAVVLYSHWGETEWQRDLSMALQHSKPRWSDMSYCTRMMISYLMQDSILESTGFGIYSINDIHADLGDTTVIIDMPHNSIIDPQGNSIAWEDFINAYGPKLSAETVAV